jgi:hypothetical protein
MKKIKLLSIVSVLFAAACSHFFDPFPNSPGYSGESSGYMNSDEICCRCLGDYSCLTNGNDSCWADSSERFLVETACVAEGGLCYQECREWFAE